jgi:hypothetical protein
MNISIWHAACLLMRKLPMEDKMRMLSKIFASGALLILGMGLPIPSYASPVVTGSTLQITGLATFNSTTINFTNSVNASGPTGSFTSFGTCSGCIDMTTPWTWISDTGQFLIDNGGGLTTLRFDVNSLGANSFNGTFLNITYNGTINLDAFSPTAGKAYFSGNPGSFSLTLVAVPEPSTLALLGAALLVLGFLQFRRMRAA